MNQNKTIWQQGTIPINQVLRDICTNSAKNTLVTVGNNGTIFRKSINGDWEPRWSGFGKNDHIYGVAANFSTTFVAGGRGGFIVQSTDNGFSWTTRRPKKIGEDITKIAFGNGIFLSILDRGKLPGSILWSKNGDTWSDIQFKIPNASSIKFFNGKFFVGTKNGNLFNGNGTKEWTKCTIQKGNSRFQAVRTLGYNPTTSTYSAAGHQVAISKDGDNWSIVLDLTKYEQWGKRNLYAIVDVEDETYLFGEDMLILQYDDSIFTQLGKLTRGTTLGACLIPDQVICVGSFGDRDIQTEDLDVIV